jgi:metal-dependent hydrolase (beta-lactamase superfamily II)
MFGEGSVAVFLELGYLIDEGDGEVVVQGCADFKICWLVGDVDGLMGEVDVLFG